MTVNSINYSTNSYGSQKATLQSTAKQNQSIQKQPTAQQTASANTTVATAKTTPSSDSLKTIKASMESSSSSTSTSTTYSAAEIALYDTNGDGTIDAIEELAMKAQQESASEDTLESGNYKLDQAISSYGQQNKSLITNSAINVVIG